MFKEEEIKTFYPKTRGEWREWLALNHASAKSVWLVYYKVGSGFPSIKYAEALDEALCFGWIDSTAKTIDNQSYRQFFSQRKPKSVWSKVNKAKVEKLIEAGLMTEAGLARIEIAKKNGSWNILDEAEALIVPPDLQMEFNKFPEAEAYFQTLSRTNKRNILQWLVLAKKEETRKKRIEEIVNLAREKKKPKQF